MADRKADTETDHSGQPVRLAGFCADSAERRQAEEALGESGTHLRLAAEAAGFGVYAYSFTTGEAFYSPEFFGLFGLPSDAVLTLDSNRVALALHPDDRALFLTHVKAANDPAGSGILDLEYRIINATGEVRWLRVRGRTVFSGNRPTDTPLRADGIVQDITDRKRIEESLRQTEENARCLARENATMAEIGRIVSSTLNIDEVYEAFAGQVREVLPFDRIVISIIHPSKNMSRNAYIAGEGISDRETDHSYPIDGSGHAEMLRTKSTLLLQTEDFREYQDRFPRLRTTFQAGFRSIMDVPLFSKGEIIGALLFRSRKCPAYTEGDVILAEKISAQIAGAIANAQLFNDLSRTEKSLRESEEKYRTLFDNAGDAIFIHDAEGRILASNVMACDHYGYTQAELMSMTVARMDAPEQCANVTERIERLMDQGTLQFETEHRRKDGTAIPVEVNARRIIWNGQPAVMSICRDITERKQAVEERQALQDRLQRSEKMETLGQLAGRVAHDLNNVLGILSGYSEILLEEIPESHRSRVHVEKILQSTEKGAAIIQDLLTMARRGVVVSEVINLNNVVSDFLKTPVFDALQAYYPCVTFRIECDENLLNIKGSPVHLEKTLMNLVSNAAEAIQGTGEVTIQTEGCYLDNAIRGYDEVREGDYAVLTVSDTGAGIPAENRGKIFEPFYTKKTMGKSGTGLGLAIVWGAVKDHQGYIDVQTEIGQGTTFTLYFPVTREGLIEQRQKVPIERYRGKGESVLVVDDVAEQREVASGLLTRLGYRVHTVASGEAAVAYLAGNQADILLLDMIMPPGIDGLETYQRVLAVNPKQKAILVSGFSETERVREAQKLGAGAYVKKPYVMEMIGVALRGELDRK